MPTERHHVSAPLAYRVLTPELVQSLADIEIVAIACGDEHAMALDDGGNVWVWGRNLVASLGLGDREDRLVPTKVEQFDQLDVVSIYAGPASSVLITDPHDESEGRRMWIAGKCKIKGPGESPRFELADIRLRQRAVREVPACRPCERCPRVGRIHLALRVYLR